MMRSPRGRVLIRASKTAIVVAISIFGLGACLKGGDLPPSAQVAGPPTTITTCPAPGESSFLTSGTQAASLESLPEGAYFFTSSSIGLLEQDSESNSTPPALTLQIGEQIQKKAGQAALTSSLQCKAAVAPQPPVSGEVSFVRGFQLGSTTSDYILRYCSLEASVTGSGFKCDDGEPESGRSNADLFAAFNGSFDSFSFYQVDSSTLELRGTKTDSNNVLLQVVVRYHYMSPSNPSVQAKVSEWLKRISPSTY